MNKTMQFLFIALLVLSGRILADVVSGTEEVKSKELAGSNVLDESMNGFEIQILRHLEEDEVVQAIKMCGEYGRDLLSRYATPVFKKGLFSSEAENMTMKVAFENWQQIKEGDFSLSSKSAMTLGVRLLLLLKGTGATDNFLLCTSNLGELAAQIGTGFGTGETLSDNELKLLSQSFAAGLGQVRTIEIKPIGKYRAVILDIEPLEGGPLVCLAGLSHKQKVHFFLLTSSVANYGKNEALFLETISSIDFNYEGPNEAKIRSVRDRFSDKDDPQTLLKCVRELVRIEEYNAATEDLMRLRMLCVEKIPKPKVVGDTAKDETYGLSVTNPDSKRWQLQVLKGGQLRGILLADQSSRGPTGILIQILDPVVLYGPEVMRIMAENMNAKEYLAVACQGAARYVGRIERERFTEVSGKLAYDTIVDVGSPQVRARMLGRLERDFVLIIVMIAEVDNFRVTAREYEKIIESYLKVKTDRPTSKLKEIGSSSASIWQRWGEYWKLSSEKEGEGFKDIKTNLIHLLGHRDSFNSIATSAGGKWVVTGDSKDITVWDIESCEEICRFAVGSGDVRQVALLENDTKVLCGKSDGQFIVWDVNTGKEIQKFGSYVGETKDLAVSGDGKYAVSCSSFEVELWDVEHGKMICGLRPPSMSGGKIASVAFSKDGRRIAAGVTQTIDKTTWSGGSPHFDFSFRGIVSVWELKNVEGNVEVKLLNELTLDGQIVADVTLSHDGSLVVFGGMGFFYLWQYESESEKQIVLKKWETTPHMRAFWGHTKPSGQRGFYDTARIVSLAFSRNGRCILSEGNDGTVRVWDVWTKREVRRFTKETGGMTCVVFSTDGDVKVFDGKLVAEAELRTRNEVSAATKKETVSGGEEKLCLRGHTAPISGVVFSPDGRYLLSASSDGSIRVWDTQEGLEIRRFGNGSGRITCLTFFADGSRVLSGHDDGMMRIWDIDTGKELSQFGGPGRPVTSIALSSEGQYAALGRLHWPYLELWEVKGGKKLVEHCLGKTVIPKISVSSLSRKAQYLDEDYGINCVSISNDGLNVAAAVETTPEGRWYSGNSDGAAFVLLESSEEWTRFPWSRDRQWWMEGSVTCVCFSPDVNQVLYSGMGWIRIADLSVTDDGKDDKKPNIRVFSGGHFKPGDAKEDMKKVFRVSALAFSEDGRFALSGGYDKFVRFWDVKTGEELRVLPGHRKGVTCVCFSPDGSLAASGSEDVTVRLWDLSIK